MKPSEGYLLGHIGWQGMEENALTNEISGKHVAYVVCIGLFITQFHTNHIVSLDSAVTN